ncbi:MAG: hypothetical protein PHV37_04095 [Candidatus Gastranaerophilales bacterium]|nr:hypothetical protein [Candidatus Gastranaerophilales bacterium]
MLVVLIMLLIILEIITGIFVMTFLIRTDKMICEVNLTVLRYKKGIINLISDYRMNIKMLNHKIKIFKREIELKKIFDILQTIASLSFIFKLKKTKVL